MNILVVDIGGTSVKILASGEVEPKPFLSGPAMTPEQMVMEIKSLILGRRFDAVSIGYPGLIKQGRIVAEPHNLAPSWVGFDFEAAFGCPVKLMNDAAMQALGSYKEGIMLFLGLGTGLGSALVVERKVIPMELGHLSYGDETYEDHVGIRGLKRLGEERWKEHVLFGMRRLIDAIHPDDVVVGGGNANRFKELPPGCRRGDNANAFIGGFRMWE